jgi:hypothetical protein
MYETPDFSLDDESEELTLEDDFGQDSELESEELSLNEDDFDFDDIEDESTQASEDFVLDLDNEEIPEDDFEEKSDDIQEDFDDYTPGILSESEKIQRKEKKGGNPFIIALLVIVAIAAIAGISYLLFRSLQGEDSPELEANSNTEENSPAPVQEVSVVAVPEVQAVPPEISTTDAVPQTESTDEEHQSDESTKVSELSVQENTKIADTTGVWYKIRWGDTLWGISYSFYNSPKDYNDIVNENKIRNPDIIFGDTKIFIPAKK